jgi:site-specific DNA-methyltransferase (cytosine-N4-specific)
MEINKIYNEPCLVTLKKMPDNFLDCVITSPPYWQLRDYGYPEQWGLEPTFQEYLNHLWEMMDEIYRVLKPIGTVWINLGDTYGTQSGGLKGKNTFDPKNKKATENVIEQPKSLHKCLLLLPHRFAIGCIDRGWIVRNDIIWAKRNGMPESTKDRFSKKHEYFFFMVKSQKYYFDMDSIRDKHKDSSIKRIEYGFKSEHDSIGSIDTEKMGDRFCNPLGKNPGDVSDFWDVQTKPSSNEHYASYNDNLLKKPILAGSQEGGLIYDPFMGTGSTAECCIRTNRLFIGSEMSNKYCEIASKRLNPLISQQKLF